METVDGIIEVRGEQVESLPTIADTGLGDEFAVVGYRLIMVIDAQRALGSLLPRRPTRQRTSSARPRA